MGKRIDPVTAEVIRGAMETVAYEMATHVSLTATTPILNQSNERNATILGAGGSLAALSVGIPQFMLSSTLPVRFALDFFKEEGLNDGDVLVANDPYHGGGHLPDTTSSRRLSLTASWSLLPAFSAITQIPAAVCPAVTTPRQSIFGPRACASRP